MRSVSNQTYMPKKETYVRPDIILVNFCAGRTFLVCSLEEGAGMYGPWT